MITTICMNPCFDKTVEMDQLRIGELNRIRRMRVDPGGKGINVAVAARQLGMEAKCIGVIGEDGAAELADMLDKKGVGHRFLSGPGRVRTNMKICLK